MTGPDKQRRLSRYRFRQKGTVVAIRPGIIGSVKQLLDKALRVGEGKRMRGYKKTVEKINLLEPEIETYDDHELREYADRLRRRAADDEDAVSLLPEAFALTREAAKRALGQRHFDVQLIGGMALNDDSIAEMRTGEGKTLTSTLAVVLNALCGNAVHLVTVNDYLARRDSEWMKPVYDMLGVTVAALQEDDDPPVRKQKYAADVLYGTNSEFGFDYLRDNLVLTPDDQVQRARDFAIVDEVDNILIDEARTPLLISGAGTEAGDLYRRFAKLVRRLEGRPAEFRSASIMSKALSDEDEDREESYDYEYDEKRKTVAPTRRGIEKAEQFLGLDNLYLSGNGVMVNHFTQALKAEALYKKDRDYAVVDGEVLIIDEFTGRILEGRRWSEGLHQAVEAKEGVTIQEEHSTVATITLQNYFRSYDRLAGMTGTALTEANEFQKIYDLSVIEIPTNKEIHRVDNPDLIFATADGKWRAVIKEIIARNEQGQPVLVGTTSVEDSEMLADRLKREGIKHEVLNAKPEHAQREGEIIAQAGRLGAVTIATNMAGRGVDIKLGGDPDGMARHDLARRGHHDPGVDAEQSDPERWEEWYQLLRETIDPLTEACEREALEVRDLGGLFILGCARHESRRIDNQLRGRAGRQGDPGETRFMISTEDDLMRIFGGERLKGLMQRLPADDRGEPQPLEMGMISKAVERAQKNVEDEHFLARKRILEYDEVLNRQREVIYEWRDQLLHGRALDADETEDKLMDLLEARSTEYFLSEHERRHQQLRETWHQDAVGFDGGAQPTQIEPAADAPGEGDLSLQDLDVWEQYLQGMGLDSGRMQAMVDAREAGRVDDSNVEAMIDEATDQMWEIYEQMSSELERSGGGHVLQQVLLQMVDQHWSEHLTEMDYLRQWIHLQGVAQIDPLVAYKNQGFEMFGRMLNRIWEEWFRFIAHIEITEMAAQPQPNTNTTSASFTITQTSGNGKKPPTTGRASDETDPTKSLYHGRKVGRNEICPFCDSGKKFKNCHGR